MSLNIDAGPRLARRGAASGRVQAWVSAWVPASVSSWMSSCVSWLVIAALFVTAIALRHVVAGNTDVSWALIAGERILDGQRLYFDILETNPPMAILAYLPGIAIARALGLRPELATDGLILVLAAASLGVTSLMLRSASALDGMRRWPLLALAVAVLIILPLHSFGQREHIALMTLLPMLAANTLRGNREPVPLWAIAVAALGAAVTLMFKPYFVLAVGGCMIAAALRSKSWRTLFAPENVIAALMVIGYGVCVVLFYPEYFTLIFPLARDVYLRLVMPWSALLGSSATMLWMAAAIFAVVLRQHGIGEEKPHEPCDTALLIVLAGSLGFAVAFYLQRKGWAYQSYPMVALGMMALGIATLTRPITTGADRRFRLMGLAVLAVIFAAGCLWFNATFNVRDIDGPVARLKAHPKILMLSGEAVIGHPLVRNLDGVWVSRQPTLWVREFVRRIRQNGAVDPQTDARFELYLARERTMLIEDIKRLPPDIILIDNLTSDWGAWVQADPELTALLKPYTLAQTIHGIDILRRTE